MMNQRITTLGSFLCIWILIISTKTAASWITRNPSYVHSAQLVLRGRLPWSTTFCLLQRSTTVARNLFWFNKDDAKNDHSASDIKPNGLVGGEGGGGGGVARVMESMEKFKRAQQVGKLTQNLVQELASTRVEGTAENGKIKVIVDGQQRPIGISIDDSYWQQQVQQQKPPMDVNDFTAALTQAMQDAHNKAAERMDEKMKGYYAELGLKPPT